MKVNRFNWTDAFVLDFAASRQFYENLFGWQFVHQHDEHGVVYSLAYLGENDSPSNSHVVAGMAECKDPQRKMNYWNSYVIVESADESVERVKSQGGKVWMEPMDVMSAGRMAVVSDTLGIFFHLWEAKEHSGTQVEKTKGAPCWYELIVSDPKKAQEFYGAVFDWEVKTMSASSGEYVLFLLNDQPVAGMHAQLEQTRGTECWLPYFLTNDLERNLKICLSFGGTVVCDPVDEPEMGRYAVVSDIEDNLFGLAEFNSD